MCSTIVGVWGEGLRMMEFPARIAGMREFTKIRYGYLFLSAEFSDSEGANRLRSKQII